MFSILTLTARLVVARWPQLLALYLAGWLARYLLIELASVFGAFSALAGLLILPLAILARLGSFIAMFLVLRRAMPAFSDLSDRGDDGVDVAGRRLPPGRVSSIFLVSIVPFFAFYAVWQLFEEDTLHYAQSALEKIDFFSGKPASSVLNLTVDPLTITIVVVAFVGRYLIKRFANRLPRWTNLIAVYFESVWVYVTIFLIMDQTENLQAWVDSRAAIHLVTDLRASLTEWFAPLGALWGGVEWVIGAAGGLVLLPIAWLTLAGIVYGRALVQPKIALRVDNRHLSRVRTRLGLLPTVVRDRARGVGKDFVGRWTPLANAVVLIWRRCAPDGNLCFGLHRARGGEPVVAARGGSAHRTPSPEFVVDEFRRHAVVRCLGTGRAGSYRSDRRGLRLLPSAARRAPRGPAGTRGAAASSAVVGGVPRAALRGRHSRRPRSQRWR